AIFASRIPIVSAVGHEIDFTIADFVADLRAPTPSAAAELIAPDVAELRRHFDATAKTLNYRVASTLEQHERVLELTAKGTLRSEPQRLLREAEQRLDDLEQRYRGGQESFWQLLVDRLNAAQRVIERHHPAQHLAGAKHGVELLEHRLNTAIRQHIAQADERIRAMRKLLKSLGPDGVLARGFTLTTDPNGKAISDVNKVRVGDMIITKLANGSIASVVTK
ncbi:MAG: exodeoxyribonuclease VII large subunit, partial [Roseimicrobium sp.]